MKELGLEVNPPKALVRLWRGRVEAVEEDGYWLLLAEVPCAAEVEAWVDLGDLRRAPNDTTAPGPLRVGRAVEVLTFEEWDETEWVPRRRLWPETGG